MVFSDHFSTLAQQYANFRPVYPDALFDWLMAQVKDHKLVWDCACGNGQASRALAERFDKVIATDGSAEQLKSALQKPNIEYRVALADASGLADHSVDLVTVAQAIHWFDFDRFYAEVRRVLKPQGVLAVWTYEHLRVEGNGIIDAIREFHDKMIEPYWPPEREYVKQMYTTLPFPFADELKPPDLRIEMQWTCDQLMGYFRSWSATKRFIDDQGFDPVAKFEPALRALWGNSSTPRHVSMKLAIRAARV